MKKKGTPENRLTGSVMHSPYLQLIDIFAVVFPQRDRSGESAEVTYDKPGRWVNQSMRVRDTADVGESSLPFCHSSFAHTLPELDTQLIINKVAFFSKTEQQKIHVLADFYSVKYSPGG